MSELLISYPASAIIARGRLTPADISLLRTEILPDGIRDSASATLLFALNNSCRQACPEWSDFFIESLTDFIVNRTLPQGGLDDANALWLERMLAADGVIATELELKLLLHVMDVSLHVPDSLKVFALSQLRHAIHGGSGALAGRRRGQQRGISRGDLDFIRTVLAAEAVQRQIIVSPAVHRVLLSIDAVSNPAATEREWFPFLYSVRASVQADHRQTDLTGRRGQSRSARTIAA